MVGVRVIICSDAIGALPSADAGAALAHGWPRARTEVVPMASAGEGFATTVAGLSDTEPAAGTVAGVLSCVVDTPERLVVCLERASADQGEGIDRYASSLIFGQMTRAAIEASSYRAPQVVVDLSGNSAHDGGAGLLAGLGADADVDLTGGAAALSGVRRVDLTAPHEVLAGRELVLVVPDGQDRLPLLGLRGITARYGSAAGWVPELMLSTDAALQSFTVATTPGRSDEPGWGACGGAGFAAAALDGRVLSGTDFCAELAGLDERCRGADLVVTGCTSYDFAHRGGTVVERATRAGAAAMVPVILIADDVFLGQREMRAMGVESAYPVRDTVQNRPERTGPGGAPEPDQLARTAQRVGRSWTW